MGFNVRRYRRKLLIKPSKAAIKRVRKQLATEMRALRGSNAEVVIFTIAPIVRGWAAYYRSGVSSKVFHALDCYLWKLTYKWATYIHPNKPKRWVVHQYFGRFNKARQDRWVFGHRSSGAYLPKFSWTKIVRHQMVAGTASPDDPALTDYWAQPRRNSRPPLDRGALRLLKAQQGRCYLCGDNLLHVEREPHSPQEWEQWRRTTRKAITKHYIVVSGREGTPGDARLVHAHCHRRQVGTGRDPALLPA
ncbi:MAG: group II intron maturase-specific domain-containing protein [Streptosporangiaceae bacterium]